MPVGLDGEEEGEEGVYEEVPLDEMSFDAEERTYYYECPCGDMFEITQAAPSPNTPYRPRYSPLAPRSPCATPAPFGFARHTAIFHNRLPFPQPFCNASLRSLKLDGFPTRFHSTNSFARPSWTKAR